MTGTRRPDGLIIGSLIAISFGTVFVMVNSADLPAPWPLALRVASAAAALALLVALFRTARTAQTAHTLGTAQTARTAQTAHTLGTAQTAHTLGTAATAGAAQTARTAQIADTVRTVLPSGNGFQDPRYWLIVAVEAVALFGGLYVINQVVKRPEIAVAWVAVVVGVHFFALAWAWRLPQFHWLGAAMTALGLAGFLAHALGAGAATVALIAGVGSGFCLYGVVVASLLQVRATRASTAV